MNYGMTEDGRDRGGIGQRRAGRAMRRSTSVSGSAGCAGQDRGRRRQDVVPVTEMEMVTFAMFTDPEGHLVGLYKSDD